jgi:tetratricopeptide (TPR) repeat protein
LKYIAATAFLAGALTLSVFAAHPTNLSGEIQGGLTESGPLVVELVGTGGGSPHRTFVSPSGTFDFRDLSQGVYELRVVNSQGEVMRRELVSAGEGYNHHTVQLPVRKDSQPTGGTISLAQLSHRIPKAARKLVGRSESLYRSGDLQGSIDALLQTVEIDPEFMAAHNNLACRYMELKRPAKAVEYYSKAIALDPSNHSIYVNLAVALIQTNRPKEAEVAARRALDLDASSVRAKYALGMSLYSAGNMTVESLQMLHASAPEFPIAGLSLAQIYSRLGWTVLASEQLSGYIQKGPPEQRAQAERWMKSLRATR